MTDKLCKRLDIKDESDINILLGSAIDLVGLIADNFSSKARVYLIEHLILSMRELNFYADKYFKGEIDKDMQEKIGKIKTIRDAICHRSSENNWLANNIKIQGCLLFRIDDVEIQYGENCIYLISGIIDLLKKFQKKFYSASFPGKIFPNPYHRMMKETELKENVEKLLKSFKKEIKNMESSQAVES